MSRLSLLVLVLAVVLLVAGLVVPTGATTIDEPSEGVAVQPTDGPNGHYASISGEDELALHFDRLNDEARTEFDEVFRITAGENGSVWIDHEMEGVTFYVDEPDNEIGEGDRLTLRPNETVTVGVAVDTTAPRSGTGEFTVGIETPGEPENTQLPSTETAAMGFPLVIGLLTVFSFGRHKL